MSPLIIIGFSLATLFAREAYATCSEELSKQYDCTDVTGKELTRITRVARKIVQGGTGLLFLDLEEACKQKQKDGSRWYVKAFYEREDGDTRIWSNNYIFTVKSGSNTPTDWTVADCERPLKMIHQIGKIHLAARKF